MKKAFEFLLMLIIFYGVYSSFENIAPMIVEQPRELWVVIASLLVSALLLVLYARMIKLSTEEKYILAIARLEADLVQKDYELKNAFSIKHAVEEEAEKTIPPSSPIL